MKVLQLVWSLDVGGMEKVVIDLCRGLPKRQIDVRLGLISHPGDIAPEAGVDQPWIGRASLNFSDSRAVESLTAYIQDERIDLVHAHNPKALQYALLAARPLRIPVICTVHGRGSRLTLQGIRSELVKSWYLHQARHVVAISHDVARKLRSINRLPAKRVSIIRNGIALPSLTAGSRPTEHMAQIRRDRGIPENALVIGSVGRLCPEKNYPLLVEAFAAVRRHHANAILAIIGDGPQRHALRSAVWRFGLQDAVVLPGMRMDVADWLCAMDVFCLCSNTEGTPIALLEAGAMALPSVVTRVGGCPEVIEDEVSGIVVPPDNAQALSAAVMRLLADETLRSTMGSRSRQRIESEYSLDSSLTGYRQVYHDCLPTKAMDATPSTTRASG